MKSVMITALAGAALAVPVPKDSIKEQFLAFMKKFSKKYAEEDVLARFKAFESNLLKIAEHDAEQEGWHMAVTEFADMTHEEFSAMYKGYRHRNNQYMRSQNLHESPSGFDASKAKSIDWTEKGAVTPVKNQAQCGSCWAFSTTGSVESANFLANNELISVSEQQLVDCAGDEGNLGCSGGLMDDAFQYIINNGGIASEESYKYTAHNGECDKSAESVVSISGFKDIKKGDEDGLMSALQQQPVSIAVDAEDGWQLYGGGIMKSCPGKSLDHGVLLVGAGKAMGKSYWKIKNSWGDSWGEEGYIRVRRGEDSCGLADSASYPTI